MIGLVNVGTGTTGSAATIVDAGYLISRVTNLLRRSDLRTEALYWLNMAQQQLAQRVKFPELLVTSPAIALVADTYSYPLPTNTQEIERVFYKANYASPSWARGLTPYPSRYYGEPIDLERQLNTAVSSRRTGDPSHYLRQGSNIIIDVSPTADTIPAELYVTYYKIPADMSTIYALPEIDVQWRQYLVWITLYWAKAALEQEDVMKSANWERKAEKVMDNLARELNTRQNPTDTYELPDLGMGDADTVF